MRKAVLCLVLLCVVGTGGLVSRAALPMLQAGQASITSPNSNAVVRGTVPVVGTAAHPDFWKYELYYAAEGTDQWFLIGIVHENQVADGLLETWETAGIPDGDYALRLRLVNRTGNYDEFFIRSIRVANAVPTDTPAPTRTAAPTATITPAATPTFVIPTSVLSQPTVTPTLARPTRSALPDVFDPQTWRESMCFGAQLMGLVLLAMAVLFVIRRLV